jgi:hypothetical protein
VALAVLVRADVRVVRVAVNDGAAAALGALKL